MFTLAFPTPVARERQQRAENQKLAELVASCMEQLRAVRDNRVQERQQVLRQLASEAQAEGRVKEGERGCGGVGVTR